MTEQEFIHKVAPLVQKYAKQYNISVCSPIIAQACLESAYGKSELAKNANNFFGLKFSQQVTPYSYTKAGSEQNKDGSYTSSIMTWCKFLTFEAGIEGYFKFITRNKRYSNLIGITDPQKYLETIKADGYATSLKYVPNNMNVITSQNLTQYDAPIKYYRVQVGAFKNKTNAERLMASIQAAGFSAIIKDYDGLFKVQLGAFSTKQSAEKELIRVKNAGFDAIINYN